MVSCLKLFAALAAYPHEPGLRLCLILLAARGGVKKLKTCFRLQYKQSQELKFASYLRRWTGKKRLFLFKSVQLGLKSVLKQKKWWKIWFNIQPEYNFFFIDKRIEHKTKALLPSRYTFYGKLLLRKWYMEKERRFTWQYPTFFFSPLPRSKKLMWHIEYYLQ